MQWTIASDELAHSGKKGMRWYHRLYQNKDGTWTALGKKRRREMSDGAKKRADRKEEGKNLKSKGELDTERTNYKITKLKNKAAVQEARSGVQTVGDKLAGKLKTGASAASKMVKQKVEEKKKHDQEVNAEEIIRSGDMNKIIKNKDKLTNAQFKEAVDRMDLERRLQGVSNAQKQDALDTYRRFAGFVNTTEAHIRATEIKIAVISIIRSMLRILPIRNLTRQATRTVMVTLQTQIARITATTLQTRLRQETLIGALSAKPNLRNE